jgi:hypothetical protein
MECLGLCKYAQVLKQQEFADPEALVLLTDEDLKEMQVLVSGAHVCRRLLSWESTFLSFHALVTLADRHADTLTHGQDTHTQTHTHTHTHTGDDWCTAQALGCNQTSTEACCLVKEYMSRTDQRIPA